MAQVVQQLLEEQETMRTLETRLAESDDALTAAAEEVAALRRLNGGERPSSSVQSIVEELHERVRACRGCNCSIKTPKIRPSNPDFLYLSTTKLCRSLLLSTPPPPWEPCSEQSCCPLHTLVASF